MGNLFAKSSNDALPQLAPPSASLWQTPEDIFNEMLREATPQWNASQLQKQWGKLKSELQKSPDQEKLQLDRYPLDTPENVNKHLLSLFERGTNHTEDTCWLIENFVLSYLFTDRQRERYDLYRAYVAGYDTEKPEVQWPPLCILLRKVLAHFPCDELSDPRAPSNHGPSIQ